VHGVSALQVRGLEGRHRYWFSLQIMQCISQASQVLRIQKYEKIQIAASKAPKFTAGAALKKAVN